MSSILSDLGINILEEEIDDVIFQTNEFLCDATFTGSQGAFWWILQMCMALAALFSIIVAAGMAYKMMVKHEPLDVMKLFRPLFISVILCWWYPPADTGITNSSNSWCVLDFLSYIPNCIGSYTHDLYQAEASHITDKFEEVQELIYVRDTMYQDLQAKADVAHSGTSDPNLLEATMEQTGVDEVTNMEKDASKLWFTSLTAGAVVGLDKIIMLIALIVFRIGSVVFAICERLFDGHGCMRISGNRLPDFYFYLWMTTVVFFFQSSWTFIGTLFRKNAWLWAICLEVLFGSVFVVFLDSDPFWFTSFYSSLYDAIGVRWMVLSHSVLGLAASALLYWGSYKLFVRMQVI